MTQDDQHLKLLSIFHSIVAAMATLLSLFPCFHLALGIAFVSGFLNDTENQADFPIIGWFFIAFSSLWILIGLTFSACVFLAGRNINARRRYKFCLLMACCECLFMPFGTVLGAFTIVFLVKDTVKAQFGVAPAGGDRG
jgi:hypothetical protein